MLSFEIHVIYPTQKLWTTKECEQMAQMYVSYTNQNFFFLRTVVALAGSYNMANVCVFVISLGDERTIFSFGEIRNERVSAIESFYVCPNA